MSIDTAPDQQTSPITPDRLTIRRIELIPIVVPLGREYRGSYYSMTHRASVLTRIHTDEGVIGQAYAADEDATLARDHGGRADRDRPAPDRPERLRRRALLGARLPRHVRPAARPADRPRRARGRRHGDLGHDRPRARTAARRALGRLPRPAPGQHHRRLLRPRGRDPRRGRGVARDGLPRLQVQARLARRRRGCRARPRRARGRAATTSSSRSTPTRATRRRWRSTSATRVSDLGIRWFEEPCRWATTRRDMRDVRARRRHPGLRRPERVLARGLPRPDGGRRHRRLQLRRLVGGRPDQLAPQRRRSRTPLGVELAHHEEPHVASHLLASQPHGTYVEVLPPRPRPDLVEHDRQPARARGRRSAAARRRPASAGSSTRTSSSATAPTASGMPPARPRVGLLVPRFTVFDGALGTERVDACGDGASCSHARSRMKSDATPARRAFNRRSHRVRYRERRPLRAAHRARRP